MNPVVLEFLAVILRWALASIGSMLVARHVLTPDQSERFAQAFAHDLALAAVPLAGLAWALWAKYRSRIKFLTALDARPGTTEREVKETIKNGMGATL